MEVVSAGQPTSRVHLLPADGADLVAHEELVGRHLGVHALQGPTDQDVVTMTL